MKAKQLKPFFFEGNDYTDVFSLSLSHASLIDKCLTPNEELQEAYTEFIKAKDFYDSCDSFESFMQSRDTNYEMHVTNTCNGESDLDNILLYSVASLKKDWFYDEDAIVYIEIHQGGDARGNYRTGQIYNMNVSSPSDSGLMDACIGFTVHEIVHGKLEQREDIDQFQIGYTRNPIYCLSETATDLTWRPRKRYFTGKLYGETLVFVPEHTSLYT